MARLGGCWAFLCRCFFQYETPKILLIRSKKVGALNRLVQALILAYVIGYVCVLKKGYQDTDSVLSSVTTKVKGVALTNSSQLGLRVWDVADYVIPPQEESSFFVMTNLIVTMNQTQTRCPEVGVPERAASPCSLGAVNGYRSVQTGKCVNFSDSARTCEVFAWCPVETDSEPPNPAVLANAENFTVLIKNSIQYPKFSFGRRNILPDVNTSYLRNCIFDRKRDPHCPIFRLGDIVSEANEDFQSMAVHGGVMGIHIRWDCDLDMPESWCVPKYTFRRLDNKDPDNNVAPGYNFRFAKYYKVADNVETRTLIKGFGIRFDVMVFGKVNVVCDWVVLTFMKKSNLYKEQKYSYVDDYALVSTSHQFHLFL
uniref:P2X purinoceptor n=1 Tax=Scleropages formosus TaxID=113540 RepID=A0A8C9SX09_SCLFO